MPDTAAIDAVVARLSRHNWVTFQELESEVGLTRDELIQIKPDVEAGLRRQDPSLRLTSRIDLSPEGFEVAG
jgi:hypothetical protein